MNTPSLDPQLRRSFDALPTPPLPAALWTRVNATRTRHIRLRWGAGIAACCVLALAAALPLRIPGGPPAMDPPVLAQGAAPTTSPPATHQSLASLDVEIQQAYNRGASDGEIAVLLSARAALLRDPTAKAVAPIRI